MNKSVISSYADAEDEKNGKGLLKYNVIPDYCSRAVEDNNENKDCMSDIFPIDDSFHT